jgi:hypothetical protein
VLTTCINAASAQDCCLLFAICSAEMAAASPSAAEYGPRAGILCAVPAAERGVATVLAVSADGDFIAYANATNVIVRSLKVRAVSLANVVTRALLVDPW